MGNPLTAGMQRPWAAGKDALNQRHNLIDLPEFAPAAMDTGIDALNDHLLVHVGLFCGLSRGSCSEELSFDCEQCFAKLTPVCKRWHDVLNSSTAWSVVPGDLGLVLHDVVFTRLPALLRVLLEAGVDPNSTRFG